MFVDFNILNQLGSPSINSNTFANRPAAGQTGRLFVSTDTFEIYRDNGTGWDLIGGPGAGTITGTGTATQVAYFTGAQTIGSSANLFWDNTAGALGINTATPGAELDVHGTGTIVQVNATGATSNAYLAFQRTGTGVWRIGDTYNGGSNFFELHNTVLTIDALEFEAATNKSTFLAQQTYASGLATGNQFTYNLTVPNGVNITSPNAVHAVNSYLNLSLGGNTTVPAGARQGLEGNSRISFTGAGTLTMTQGSTVRAFSALSSVYSFNGSAVGTVTHLAGLRICFPDNIGSAINITNNYGILINNQTSGLGTVNYTNRWGIYQEGTLDINTFAGNVLVGTTTNVGANIYTNGSLRTDSSTTLAATSGGVLIGSTGAISSNAALQIDSISAGVLLPRMTTAQRNAISGGPSAGLVIYNTTTTALEFYNGTAWTSGGGGGITGSGTTNYLPKFTAGTVVGDSRFFDNGTVTFLGNGDVNAAPSTGIFSGTGGTGTNIAGAELRIRGGASTGNAAGGPLTFYTSAAGVAGALVNTALERMRLSAGNLLINQTTSLTGSTNSIELTGSGNIDATQQANYSIFANHGTFAINTGYFVFNKSRGTTAGSTTIVASGDRLGMIRFNGADGTAQVRAAEIYAEVDGTPGVNDMPGRLLFATSLDGTATPSERMRIDNTGNIGIGTATIGSRLQVNGNAAIGYSASTAAPTNGLQVAGATNLNGLVTLADAVNIAVNATTGTIIATATTQKLSFWNKTPIVQPTTGVAGAARVAGGGATVTDTDTFGGYTIAQVVAALRNVGLLA